MDGAARLERRFSDWVSWENRNSLAGADQPGVYVTARSDRSIAGEPFSWREEIIYVGMTNAPYGLKGRLGHFDATISGKAHNHGGGERVRHKFPVYQSLWPQLYVAVVPFACDVKSNKPKDLIVMGKVAEFEYVTFAQFAEEFGGLPEFNDKKRSPKPPRTTCTT